MPLADLTDSPPDNDPPKKLHIYMDSSDDKKDLPVVEDSGDISSPDNSVIGSAIERIVGRLTGTNGYERYQTWPEKMVREAITTPHDAMTGQLPMNAVDPLTGEVHTSSQAIEGAQAIAGMAGTGGLSSMTDATLGSTPFLRPALKYGEKIYKAPAGGQHLDAIPPDIYPEFQRQAMSGEDISNFNFGFMNHKGQFLDRQKALDYALENGLVDQNAGKYGALTSTLMSESGTPGMAIEAAAKANPFFSAVEHAVNNTGQAKMTGSQWLGTLSNKPGVKPEEMQWTGLNDFLKENGNASVTREQVQEHLANNKVSLSEINKGNPDLKNIAEDLQKSVGNSVVVKGEKLYPDEVESGLYDGSIAPEDLPTNLQDKARSLLKARDNQNEHTKYHSYQLPGGENYREMLMTLPETSPVVKEMQSNQKRIGELNSNKGMLKPDEQDEYIKLIDRNKELRSKIPDTYKSSHWDEPNILAHVRMNDRTIDGKKSLHLEEIQSDWHQQGRDKGYASVENKAKYDKLIEDKHKAATDVNTIEAKLKSDVAKGYDIHNLTSEEKQLLTNKLNDAKQNSKEYQDAYKSYKSFSDEITDGNPHLGVPDAPFKKTWHELALKRMIREAAEKGYDRLSWTPGEAQAARYDLSKSVDNLHYSPNQKKLVGKKDGKVVVSQENVTPDKLPDIVGKEASKKLLSDDATMFKGTPSQFHTLEGEQLKIGGEGMKGFYDSIIPKAIEKIGKEHGVKVKQMTLPPAGIGMSKGDVGKVHFIDIPQSLRDTAMHKGFPLFSGGLVFTPVDGDPTK